MKEVRVIQSVQRAIDIVNCFSEHDFYLSLHDISDRLNLNINTTRGLVQTLVDNDVLLFDSSRKLYSLSFFFNMKAQIFNNNIAPLIDLCAPFIQKTTAEARTFCSLQIVQDDHVRQIFSDSPDDVRYRIVWNTQAPLPLHCSASGKLLLAYKLEPSNTAVLQSLELDNEKQMRALSKELEQIRKQSYSCENDEFEPSIYSIAVPLFDMTHELLGTLSTSGFITDLEPRKDELLQYLNKARAEIEAALVESQFRFGVG